MKDWFIFLFVHIAIPVLGMAVYLMLLRKMKNDGTPNPPSTELFWLFGIYGVVVILVLTSLIWKWSGMASIGAFLAIIIGPIIAGISAFSVYKNRKLTKYHIFTYWLSMGYIGFVLLVISASLLINGIK